MIEEMRKTITKKMLELELKRFGIELKHYIPGRVRIGLKNWQFKEDTIKKIIEDLSADPDIISIAYTPETATVLIYYNHQAVMQESTQNRWFSFYKKYS